MAASTKEVLLQSILQELRTQTANQQNIQDQMQQLWEKSRAQLKPDPKSCDVLRFAIAISASWECTSRFGKAILRFGEALRRPLRFCDLSAICDFSAISPRFLCDSDWEGEGVGRGGRGGTVERLSSQCRAFHCLLRPVTPQELEQ